MYDVEQLMITLRESVAPIGERSGEYETGHGSRAPQRVRATLALPAPQPPSPWQLALSCTEQNRTQCVSLLMMHNTTRLMLCCIGDCVYSRQAYPDVRPCLEALFKLHYQYDWVTCENAISLVLHGSVFALSTVHPFTG
jgi:hypothetical protein